MSWGTVIIGGIEFREELSVDQSSDGTLRIVGQESTPPSSVAHVMAAHHNVIGLGDLTVPVVFSDKVELSGFYRVADARSTLFRFANGSVQSATWGVALERVGASRDVEIESRVPTIPRLDELAGTQTPSYWHAPAVGFTSYWTGSTVPAGSVARASSDGTVTVHTGIPTNIAPRWTVAASDYLLGSSRVMLDGTRRAGTFTPPPAVMEGFGTAPFGLSAFGGSGVPVWEIHNGLVRVIPGSGGALAVSCWDDGAWRSEKEFVPQINGVSLADAPEMTVLRNDPEEVTIRLAYPTSVGRVTVDLSLRRGANFVTGVLKRHSAATLGVARTAAETATAVTGGLVATAADADGNNFMLGSSRAVTTTTATASISKASVTSFDFFMGLGVDVSADAAGAFAAMLAQYLASSGERTRVVRR